MLPFALYKKPLSNTVLKISKMWTALAEAATLAPLEMQVLSYILFNLKKNDSSC